MRWNVLVTAPYFLPVVERFRPRLEGAGARLVLLPVAERAEEDDLLGVIADIDGVVCGDDRFTARVVDRADRLKVISKWGTGIDSIDRDACARRGIAVCNTPDAFTVPVADSVLAFALAFARNVPFLDRAMKGGEWRKLQGGALGESAFGVVGVGRIGARVARLASAFGCRLLGNDIVPIPEAVLAETGMRSVSLEELLRESDIVSLNCDLNPTSRHLMDEGRLGRMKPGAVLINTARGPVVDEAALCRALAAGRLRGAALDVFEDEPLPEGSPLRCMDNVLLSPHNSNSSAAAWERVHESTVANLLRVLEERSG